MWVYKITNLINQKCYVGITNNLRNRFNQHKNFKKRDENKPLYLAFDKYGINNFDFSIIEEDIEDPEELGRKERYYIKLYKSHISQNGYNITWGGERCQFDANPRTKLTVDDIIQIRKEYAKCEIGVKACWELYKDKISYSAFEKIWEYRTWKEIMPEVYTKENKQRHIMLMGKNNSGDKNQNALLTNEEVFEIRKYYVSHSLRETYEKYGQKYKSKCSFRKVLDRSYNNIPIYNKIKKQWLLNGKIININKYNPVSTIAESGE